MLVRTPEDLRQVEQIPKEYALEKEVCLIVYNQRSS